MKKVEISPPQAKIPSPQESKSSGSGLNLKDLQKGLRNLLFAGTAAAGALYANPAQALETDSGFNVQCDLTVKAGYMQAECRGEKKYALDSIGLDSKKGIESVIKVNRDGITYTCPALFEYPRNPNNGPNKQVLKQIDGNTILCYPPNAEEFEIQIDLSKQRLMVYQNQKLIRTFPVSTGREVVRNGKPPTPTPTGKRYIEFKEPLHKSKAMEDGKEVNFESELWMNIGGAYAIHAAPAKLDDSDYQRKALRYIGRIPKSHGCIRMFFDDAQYLYEHMPRKVLVNIIRSEINEKIELATATQHVRAGRSLVKGNGAEKEELYPLRKPRIRPSRR